MNRTFYIASILLILLFTQVCAGKINIKQLPSDKEILSELDANIPAIHSIIELRDAGDTDGALQELVKYLKEHAAERYYFSWKNFETRFNKYKNAYPSEFKKHKKQANYHMSTYGAETKWELPAVDLKGRDVTAYELRHLSRQQKSADMTLTYFYENQDPKYLDYFVHQVADLNRAFTAEAIDQGGNAVYESYRAGKRIHNWLFNYNAYLSSKDFKPEDQLLLVRTFLHHGAQLTKRTKNFRYGNHQTKGLVALFEITTLLPEFKCTKQWQQHAIEGLSWHISREINPDGFQFERTVHYHMGDVENYFRVYQLAKINDIELPEIFTSQFRKMFESLVKLAQPNRHLPVLQDDTDAPYKENNDVRGTMTIGTLLFEDPSFRYFADDTIPASIYWFLSSEQLSVLSNVVPHMPDFGSTALKETGYFTMRGGWQPDDLYMTITAGLSEQKPDHQHADILGLVAYANGHEILPNYQTRYKHPEYKHFKNSWVKSLALVDSFVQGQKWKQNSGKSGFGKWLDLPEPKVLSWITEDSFDYFNGRHNGFESLNIEYNREVLFIKNKFWLVRDKFESSDAHMYQQVWQGKYETNSPVEAIKTYDDGSGLLIRQLNGKKYRRTTGGGIREKFNLTFAKHAGDGFTFSTLLLPFTADDSSELPANWQVNNSQVFDLEYDAEFSLSSKTDIFLFDLKSLNYSGKIWKFETPVSVRINREDTGMKLRLLSGTEVKMTEHKKDQVVKKILKSDTTQEL